VYTVRYAVDGVTHSTTLYGETAWQEFLNRMFALAEEGCRVSFCNENNSGNMAATKERVVYTTTDKHDAEVWVTIMANNGYTVSVEYNQQTGVYTCIAIR